MLPPVSSHCITLLFKCDWAVNDIFDINGLVFDVKFVVKSVAKTSVPSWSPTVYDSVSIWLPALLRILHLRLNVPWPSTVHWYCTVCDRHTELWQVLSWATPIK